MIDPDGRAPKAASGRKAAVFLVLAIAVVAVTWMVRATAIQDDVLVASFTVGGGEADTLAALISHGERVYQGKVGGALCATCHGPEAKGVPGIGPDLTDGKWLHGDGSREFLRAIIRTGVSRPKATAAVMPPYGGSPLKPDQLEAVAAYIHSLNTAAR
jgi:mono/diheme cytochrome c family protein